MLPCIFAALIDISRAADDLLSDMRDWRLALSIWLPIAWLLFMLAAVLASA
jgi:hypothetical protein